MTEDTDNHDGCVKYTRIDGLLLVELAVATDKPLYFIVQYPVAFGGEHSDCKCVDDYLYCLEYAVDENSCPRNFIPCVEIFHGNQKDPHGILSYVDWKPLPDDWDAEKKTCDFVKLFPELGEQ